MTPMHMFEEEVKEKKHRAQTIMDIHLRCESHPQAKKMQDVIATCDKILLELEHGHYDEQGMTVKLSVVSNVAF